MLAPLDVEMGIWVSLWCPRSACVCPSGPPAHPPALAAARAQAAAGIAGLCRGTGAHPQLCALLADPVMHHIRQTRCEVQGPCFGAGMFRAMMGRLAGPAGL